tara:strand:+ start:886 stop:1035 length:150 start_codon:yes stop_codon:yes gene_type:complete
VEVGIFIETRQVKKQDKARESLASMDSLDLLVGIKHTKRNTEGKVDKAY